MNPNPPQPPPDASDIFSLSDQVLSDRLQFVTEVRMRWFDLGDDETMTVFVQIGFGNWGSVWLCRPKGNPMSPSADRLTKLQDVKVAVKVVHRTKTTTTAARVRSLFVVTLY